MNFRDYIFVIDDVLERLSYPDIPDKEFDSLIVIESYRKGNM